MQRVRVAERCVVERRRMPRVVDDEPQREAEPRGHEPGQPPAELGRQPEHEERRGPLRQDDVLQQVRGQQLELELVERPDEGREREQCAGREAEETRAAPIHRGYATAARPWCSGNTRAFQALVTGSIPVGRFGS